MGAVRFTILGGNEHEVEVFRVVELAAGTSRVVVSIAHERHEGQ